MAKGKLSVHEYNELLSIGPAVIYASDASSPYAATYISENVKQQMGYEPEDFLSDPQFWADHIHPEDTPGIFDGLPELFEKAHHSHEYRFLHKDGTYSWMHADLNLVYDKEGNPEKIIGYWIDITERKQAEEKQQDLESQLRHSQKMQAIGILAGGIAHDFNNILGTMMGYTEILLDSQVENSEGEEYLHQVQIAGKRAEQLIKRILCFSRYKAVQLTPISIAPIIKETLQIVRAALSSRIQIREHIDPNGGLILADVIQIQQIILNLCINASQSVGAGSQVIDVRLEPIALDRSSLTPLPAGDYLKLAVQDSGPGIDAEIQSRIFEPFFTTRELGEGTGLGLSIVYNIVQNHHGWINVSSEVGKGATFEVLLPLTEQIAQTEPVPEVVPLATKSAGETILVVEDEEPLLQAYKIALEKRGYLVITSSDGAEAQAIFEVAPNRFACIFTDQTMPRLNGSELSKQVLKIRPDMPIILATGLGLSSAITEQETEEIGIRGYFLKPVNLRQLHHKIQTINRPGQGA